MKIERKRLASSKLDAESFYRLISDMRHFRVFIPGDLKDKYRADENTCSISLDQIGTLNLHLTGKKPFSKASFSGTAVSKIALASEVNITPVAGNSCEAEIIFALETDQFTGMFISPVIDGFLDKMVLEIEAYTGRGSITSTESPPL